MVQRGGYYPNSMEKNAVFIDKKGCFNSVIAITILAATQVCVSHHHYCYKLEVCRR